MGARAPTVGLELQPAERPITPDLWPRVGNVDVEVRAIRDPKFVAFMELKWPRADKVWHCVWDVAKAALLSYAGLATHTLLLVGATTTERRTRYGTVQEPTDWSTRVARRT